MSDTSVMAYVALEKSGMLGKLQLQVLKVISEHGPITSGEITELHLKKPRVSISPRLAELKRQGVVRESVKRPCGVTNKICIAWDLTGDLPIILTKKEKIELEIVRLIAKIDKLRSQLLE